MIADTGLVEACQNPKPSILKGSHYLPSLSPPYLPLRTQHFLLVKVQTILEQACFGFAKQAMPDVLRQNQWDCPESVELNRWATELPKRRSVFAKNRDIGKPLEELFHSVINIRHTAVHRIRVSAKEIEQFLLDAESLATLLGDLESLELLKKLREDTQLTIKELERNKHSLNTKLEEVLKSIAAQKAELERLKEVAIAEMEKEDRDYQVVAGANLEQTIECSDVAKLIAAAIEDEINSDVDDSDDSDNSEDYTESRLAGVSVL
jgi:hypothetical protein